MIRSDRRRGQRGVALLTMLLVAALATTLVVALLGQQMRVQRELGGQLQQDQMAEYHRGAGLFALAALREDARGGSTVDHPGEFWAQPFPPFPVPGGVIMPVLRDAQSRFNLNSLVSGRQLNDDAVAVYRTILQANALPPELADSLIDWLDADTLPFSAQGAEDDYYLRQSPSYRAGNQSLSTYSELRLVRGYSQDVLRTLAPWVVVLPSRASQLNVNFLTPALLEALLPSIPPASALALLQNRPPAGWKKVDEFLDNPLFNGVDADSVARLRRLLTVRSDYFELYTRIRLADRERQSWSLILREQRGAKLAVIANERNPAWVPVFEALPVAAVSEPDQEEQGTP